MTANAAIYAVTKEVIPVKKLHEITGQDNILIKEDLLGSILQMKIAWVDCVVTINLMSSEKISDHIKGFLGYIKHLSHDGIDPRTKELIRRVSDTRQVMGIVVEPDLDSQGKCKQLILGVATHYNGLLFANNSIYNSNGDLQLGPKGAGNY